jgi:hypothetical protein
VDSSRLSRLSRWAVALPLVVLCTGCPGTLANPAWADIGEADAAPPSTPSTMSDAGPDSVAPCADVPSVTFADSCALGGCHDSVSKVNGLDLQSPGLAARLVGVMAVGGPGLLIDPTNPAESVVYTKLTATPPFGSRMPAAMGLDDGTIQCVLGWVTQQAAPTQAIADAATPPADSAAPGDGSPADASPVTAFSTLRIAAGQTSPVTDSMGNIWSADEDFTAGTPYVQPTAVAIAGTATPALYNAERYGNPSFTYTATVPNGTYAVTLKFAELYVTGPGLRLFDIAINGTTVAASFDIYAAAGAMNTAVDKTFTATVTSGTLQIAFIAGTVQNPKVDAIQIAQGATTGDGGP